VLSVLAVVRSTPGARELRLSNRVDSRGDRRIVLVLGAERPWVLTGLLQRLLRAHGDRTPHVEVLPDGLEPATYHQAAIVGSALLWSAPPRTTTPTGSAAGEST
jgi:hypothetical protein